MKVKVNTIVRLIALIVTLVNIILGLFGVTPLDFDEATVYTVVSSVAVVVVPLWTAWKNNSFTKSALIADAYLEEVRKLDNELNEGGSDDE